jgi:hypothetical protein
VRSVILPGWGQFYNRRPLKGLFFTTASGALLGSAIAEQGALNNARTPQEHEDRAARRNTRILFFALSVTFSAVDAYVDAHLARFAAGDAPLAFAPRPGGAVLCLRVGW